MDAKLKASAIQKIKKYKRLSAKLARVGGPESDGELFEEVIGLEREVLELFGLPDTEDHAALLQNTVVESDGSIEMLVFLLDAMAGEEANLAPLEQLYLGVIQGDSPGNVLPRMGLIHHTYFEFLYDLVSQEPSLLVEAYNEMQRAQPFLNDIGIVQHKVEELEQKNVRFLKYFLFGFSTADEYSEE
jgi:hypothetical protein